MARQTEINQVSHQLRIKTEADLKEAENNARKAILSGKSLPSDEPTIFVENAVVETENWLMPAKVTTSAPATVTSETKTTSETTTTRMVGNIDMNRVEAAWMGWVNEVREKEGLKPYKTNALLGKTAQEWSEFSRDRGYTTHGRPGDGCVGEKNYTCYNFQAIDKWFTDRGVNATIINRSKHTENVGYGSYRCNAADCTDAAIKAIRKTFDYFYSEKSYNGSHYKSMVNKNFTDMGLGLAIKNGTYYVTIHYTTPLK